MPYNLLKIKSPLLCKSLNAYGITLKMHPSRHSCSFAEVVYIAHKRAVWKNQRTITWYFKGSLIAWCYRCIKKKNIHSLFLHGSRRSSVAQRIDTKTGLHAQNFINRICSWWHILTTLMKATFGRKQNKKIGRQKVGKGWTLLSDHLGRQQCCPKWASSSGLLSSAAVVMIKMIFTMPFLSYYELFLSTHSNSLLVSDMSSSGWSTLVKSGHHTLVGWWASRHTHT